MTKEERKELLSLVARFLDPGCHSDRAFVPLAREIVRSPKLGALAREVLAVAEKMGIRSPTDALDAFREKTGLLLGELCCEPGTEVVDSLLGEPWRPGTDPPFAWFEECCDRCYGVFFRALERQHYLCTPSAFDAWNLFPGEDPLARALSELEVEASARFTEPPRGLDACRTAYRLTREALPKTPGRVDDPERAVALSVHAVAAARLMNAYRYTSDVPRAREMLGEVERLVPACLPFHRAEVNALIGVLRTDFGDIDEALTRLKTTIDSLRGQDKHLAGRWILQRAETERDAGRDSYFVTVKKGLQDLDPRRDAVLYQIATINLSSALAHNDQPTAALRILRSLRFKNRMFAATGNAIIAAIYRELGDLDTALRYVSLALEEYTALDKANDLAACLLLRGEIHQENGAVTYALGDFWAATQIYEAVTAPSLKASAIQELRETVRAGNACKATILARKIREQPKPLPLHRKDVSPIR